ncbi:hypothetical protein B0H14DRAFT_3893292 [Mycena olivaceomarginata]|nr:hypothetical protein B0H14DRAFT_3893292 [Mycena olivaceomarginata]
MSEIIGYTSPSLRSITTWLIKELLKKLEQDRSLARRQLNAVMDPVARLPLEISSEIFLQTLGPSPLKPGARHVPMLPLNFWNGWTTIALSTPTLWTAIRIDFARTNGLIQALPLWFERGRNRPVSLSLHGKFSTFDGVSPTIWQHGGTWKYTMTSTMMKTQTSDDPTPRPLPLLETLTVSTGNAKRGFLSPQIQLLLLAPNIVSCTFENIVRWHDLDVTLEKLVVPTLRRLMFGNRGDAKILDHLSLPTLEVLSVSIAIPGDDLRLFSFLARSSPPLQELVLGLRYDFLLIRLHQSLHLIPGAGARRPGAADLFAALADSPSLLPNLHSLTVFFRWA